MSDVSALENPTDTLVKALLEGMQTIAVVGFSANPERASHGVARFLAGQNLKVIGVNPGLVGQEILGLTLVASLADIDEPIDVVNVFRRNDAIPDIVAAAITAGARAIWMQEGVSHDEAAAAAQDAGLTVIQDRCLYKEWLRLLNG